MTLLNALMKIWLVRMAYLASLKIIVGLAENLTNVLISFPEI